MEKFLITALLALAVSAQAALIGDAPLLDESTETKVYEQHPTDRSRVIKITHRGLQGCKVRPRGNSRAQHGGEAFAVVRECFQHALAYPEENRGQFERIEVKLDELRSYLYANRQSVVGYAEAYRNGERISTAHVESTINRLINWRMCKKQQMGWSRAGAQYLLYVKTAAINRRLERYTGVHPIPAPTSIACPTAGNLP
jgi:hypothetical protein